MPTVLGLTPGAGASSALANAAFARIRDAMRTTKTDVKVRRMDLAELVIVRNV
jgi:hypothetical protein